MATTKKTARKRELIEPTPEDRRYVRRDSKGQFKDVVDVGRSLAAEGRSQSKTKVKPGQGDKGDVARPSTKKATATNKRPRHDAPLLTGDATFPNTKAARRGGF